MKINELVEKQVHLFTNDAKIITGIIEDWNEYGVLIKITQSMEVTYARGKTYFISHSAGSIFQVV